MLACRKSGNLRGLQPNVQMVPVLTLVLPDTHSRRALEGRARPRGKTSWTQRPPPPGRRAPPTLRACGCRAFQPPLLNESASRGVLSPRAAAACPRHPGPPGLDAGLGAAIGGDAGSPWAGCAPRPGRTASRPLLCPLSRLLTPRATPEPSAGREAPDGKQPGTSNNCGAGCHGLACPRVATAHRPPRPHACPHTQTRTRARVLSSLTSATAAFRRVLRSVAPEQQITTRSAVTTGEKTFLKRSFHNYTLASKWTKSNKTFESGPCLL